MSPEVLHNGAHILLAAGIVLFILTVILAVKFDILQMLKAELTGKKAVAPTPESTAAQPVSAPELEPYKPEPVYREETPPVKPVQVENKPDAELNATVVVSSHKSAPQSSGTVVASRRKKTEEPKDDYVMIENIIVIHGDPNITNI